MPHDTRLPILIESNGGVFNECLPDSTELIPLTVARLDLPVEELQVIHPGAKSSVLQEGTSKEENISARFSPSFGLLRALQLLQRNKS